MSVIWRIISDSCIDFCQFSDFIIMGKRRRVKTRRRRRRRFSVALSQELTHTTGGPGFHSLFEFKKLIINHIFHILSLYQLPLKIKNWQINVILLFLSVLNDFHYASGFCRLWFMNQSIHYMHNAMWFVCITCYVESHRRYSVSSNNCWFFFWVELWLFFFVKTPRTDPTYFGNYLLCHVLSSSSFRSQCKKFPNFTIHANSANFNSTVYC